MVTAIHHLTNHPPHYHQLTTPYSHLTSPTHHHLTKYHTTQHHVSHQHPNLPPHSHPSNTQPNPTLPTTPHNTHPIYHYYHIHHHPTVQHITIYLFLIQNILQYNCTYPGIVKLFILKIKLMKTH